MRYMAATALMAGLAFSAQAATVTVHKCRTVVGNVLYQSTPCPPGERTLAVWDAAPDPPTPAASRSRAAEPQRRSPQRRSARARYRSHAVDMASADGCAAAKARRDEIERRVGLARTYELLSALNREVFDACK